MIPSARGPYFRTAAADAVGYHAGVNRNCMTLQPDDPEADYSAALTTTFWSDRK